MKLLTIGNLPRLLVVIFFAAFLASCSSSSSQGAGDFDVNDSNQDGVVDFADGDYDGNGVVDTADLDFNGDGFTDSLDDRNGDGFVDADDFDINGDGVNDAADDANSDGIVNIADVGVTNVICSGATNDGTDENSSNDDWADNCIVSTSLNTESSYTRGIQRILWCQGFAPTGVSFDQFTDGDYGPNTAQAVTDFQTADTTIGVDGIVGMETWGALQDALEPLSSDGTYQAWGVNSVDCAGQAMFYQQLDGNGAGIGWELAATRGSADRSVFSTGF